VWTLGRPAVFPVTKDRPILFSALAWADVLLTLDRNDFAELLGSEFYGLAVLKPGSVLVSTAAPAARASSGVPSMDPSSTTITSSTLGPAFANSMTDRTRSDSFSTGMITEIMLVSFRGEASCRS
jgi:hypothetical protein